MEVEEKARDILYTTDVDVITEALREAQRDGARQMQDRAARECAEHPDHESTAYIEQCIRGLDVGDVLDQEGGGDE